MSACVRWGTFPLPWHSPHTERPSRPSEIHFPGFARLCPVFTDAASGASASICSVVSVCIGESRSFAGKENSPNSPRQAMRCRAVLPRVHDRSFQQLLFQHEPIEAAPRGASTVKVERSTASNTLTARSERQNRRPVRILPRSSEWLLKCHVERSGSISDLHLGEFLRDFPPSRGCANAQRRPRGVAERGVFGEATRPRPARAAEVSARGSAAFRPALWRKLRRDSPLDAAAQQRHHRGGAGGEVSGCAQESPHEHTRSLRRGRGLTPPR